MLHFYPITTLVERLILLELRKVSLETSFRNKITFSLTAPSKAKTNLFCPLNASLKYDV